MPRTIENTREHDVTTVDPEDEEVQFDIAHDEYESYFTKTYEPKILITSSDNPHTVMTFITFYDWSFFIKFVNTYIID